MFSARNVDQTHHRHHMCVCVCVWLFFPHFHRYFVCMTVNALQILYDCMHFANSITLFHSLSLSPSRRSLAFKFQAFS